jgi:hypothetical protein
MITDLKAHIEEYDKEVLVDIIKAVMELRAWATNEQRPYLPGVSKYLKKEEP